ncbi:DUF4352 domain-containing protein [Staphylococcus sp. IVB6246]|uniref:DUF4352 domain-containing protein n=1 Tax=Staphylococcus sp. IVB6246 TaxID=2989772 RepID=UPI0021CFCAB8|nr:DUF4352 domain-containing protein [Staphylococcus sp. IVB6246]UXR70258.1 DUF4352 domain-containing protein [Staphylococcus sp. IVB6246]
MKKLIGMALASTLILGACGSDEGSESSNSEKELKNQEDTANKTFKVGDTIKGDGVSYTLESVEYADTSGEFSTATDNGVALKVNLSFKNENEEQVLVTDADVTMKVNGQNYQQWYGCDDVRGNFAHQLNKGNTATGYVYFDVPEADEYTLELNAMPVFKEVKGKWQIKSSDIK